MTVKINELLVKWDLVVWIKVICVGHLPFLMLNSQWLCTENTMAITNKTSISPRKYIARIWIVVLFEMHVHYCPSIVPIVPVAIVHFLLLALMHSNRLHSFPLLSVDDVLYAFVVKWRIFRYPVSLLYLYWRICNFLVTSCVCGNLIFREQLISVLVIFFMHKPKQKFTKRINIAIVNRWWEVNRARTHTKAYEMGSKNI